MAGLPTTFFFRLNSHQATIVVGVFEIVFYFAAFLILCLADLVVNPKDVEVSHVLSLKEVGRAHAAFQLQKHLTICEFYALFNIFFAAIAVYVVLSQRRRWLMVPWLVVRGFDLMNFIVQFIKIVDFTLALPISDTTMSMAFFLGSTLAITLIGAGCYCQLAAVTSFLEIGAHANQDTPNGDVQDLPVQFQPFDLNVWEVKMSILFSLGLNLILVLIIRLLLSQMFNPLSQ